MYYIYSYIINKNVLFNSEDRCPSSELPYESDRLMNRLKMTGRHSNLQRSLYASNFMIESAFGALQKIFI